MSIKKLIPANMLDLKPYQSARKLGGNGTIWLNANEYPCSPKFSVNSNKFNRYPQPQPQALLEKYANYSGLSPENILVCRGGDEGIELIMRAFCQANQDAILYCPPTYGMYQISANSFAIKTILVPQLMDFQLDLAAIKAQLDSNPQIKVLYICNPNNPTGTVLNYRDLAELLEITRDRAILVIDEAYIEFSPANSLVGELKNNPHLAIIRTLSKAFALAGLRVGFVLANVELIQLLNAIIAPYPIASVVADIAEQALSPEHIAQVQHNIRTIIAERQRLVEELKGLSQIEEIYASHANFILIKARDGNGLFNSLWEQGIILRNQHSQPLLENCIRTTIGTEAENNAVIAAIKNY